MPDLLAPFLNIKEQLNIAGKIAQFPALTVMVFLRRRLGYRQVSPGRVWFLTVLLLTGAMITSSVGDKPGGGKFLAIFALAMFALGMLERYRRKRELMDGKKWHSYWAMTIILHLSAN